MKATSISAMAMRMPVSFPQEFKKGLLKSVDRRYWAIFAVCFAVSLGTIANSVRLNRPLDINLDYIIRRIPGTKIAIDVKELEALEVDPKVEEPLFRRLESMNSAQRRASFQEYLKQQAQARHDRIAQQLSQRMNEMNSRLQNSGSRFAIISSTSGRETYNNFSSNERELEYGERELTAEQIRNGQITVNLNTTSREISSNLNLESANALIVLPTPTLDRNASASGLSANDVLGVISKNESVIQAIYTRFLNQSPDLRGKVRVRISFDKTGRVLNVTVEQNTTGNAAFEREIVSKIRGWRFPSSQQKRGTVTISQAFIFGK